MTTKRAGYVIPELSIMHGVTAEHARAFAELRSRRQIVVIGTDSGTEADRRMRQLSSQASKRRRRDAGGQPKRKARKKRGPTRDGSEGSPMDGALPPCRPCGPLGEQLHDTCN